MEQSSIGPKPDFIDDGGLEVHEHSPGHVLAGSGLGEEGVEGVITATGCLIRWHGAIRLDAWQYWVSIKKPLILSNFLVITVFKTVKFPAGISNLAASLANVDRNTLSLNKEEDALKNIILH